MLWTCRIIWPFGSDQPLNAIIVSEKLQIGYELIEVRGGNGLKPICRNGRVPTGTIDAVKAEMREVLDKAFGEDGEQKRARLAQVKKAALSEWEDGGTSKHDMVAFLDTVPLALPCLDYSPGLPCW